MLCRRKLIILLFNVVIMVLHIMLGTHDHRRACGVIRGSNKVYIYYCVHNYYSHYRHNTPYLYLLLATPARRTGTRGTRGTGTRGTRSTRGTGARGARGTVRER